MTSVYILPVSSSRQSSSPSKRSVKKRKRTTAHCQAVEPGEEELRDKTSKPEEYAAVLTPDERAQRRLAGHSLVKDLPFHPFPHRAPPPPQHTTSEPVTIGRPRNTTETSNDEPQSLRLQHISAMSAVLHKSLLRRDYARARRAFGLILRTDINGKAIDIRAAGNWAIGAEILFRQYDQQFDPDQSIGLRRERRRRGFAKAKGLYEMLIVQYPFHKSWPDSVNAVDFYLAMFSLWIYVAQAAGQDVSNADLGGDDPMRDASDRSESRMQELQQANEIGAQMDKLMVAAPYSDNRDLLRLRAMVAEWQADLNDECEDHIPNETAVNLETGAPGDSYTSAVQALSPNVQQ